MNEQGSMEWYKERLGRTTSSRFSAIMPGPESRAYLSYATQIRSEQKLLDRINAGENVDLGPDFYSAATAWGKKYEPIARAEYEFINDCDIEVPAFMVHPQYNFVGASLDGIHLRWQLEHGVKWAQMIEARIGLEAKCPYNQEVHARTLLHGMEDEHQPQTQGEIWVAELDAVDYVSLDPRRTDRDGYYQWRVWRDDTYISLLEKRVLEFWDFVQSGADTPQVVESGFVPMLF